MTQRLTFPNLLTLKQALLKAEQTGCALGAFSPRRTPMIQPVLLAGEALQSPVIVEIAHKELELSQITPQEFADEFYHQLEALGTTIPVVLHLDHTMSLDDIIPAIDAGFTSVMIDASRLPLEENIAVTKEVVEYAHARGVSVEGELGKIGTTDFFETAVDEVMYTVPEEAERFVAETGVDALAVSVGTAHGAYLVRQPKIDLERLQAIRALTPVHLVLHGGSGVPAEMVQKAIRLPGGGVSKVNIATDLELAWLEALGREGYWTNAEVLALPPEQLATARAAVEEAVAEKITGFLGSKGHAAAF